MLSTFDPAGHCAWRIAFGLLAASSAAQGMAQTASPEVTRSAEHKSIYTVSTYGPERDAARDLAATVKQAKAGGKRIILEVGGDW